MGPIPAGAPLSLLGPHILRTWEARCQLTEGGLHANWTTDENRHLVQAVSAFLTTGDSSPLADAARAWGHANPSMPILLSRVSCLRDTLVGLPGLDDARHFQTILDGLTSAAVAGATAQLADAAFTDPLTGVGNRRALEDDARAALAEADRANRVVSIVAIDLRGLKVVNDTRGHAAGDVLIAGFTASMRAALRDSDRLFRVGGDEFVALLPSAQGERDSDLMPRATRFNAPPFSWAWPPLRRTDEIWESSWRSPIDGCMTPAASWILTPTAQSRRRTPIQPSKNAAVAIGPF